MSARVLRTALALAGLAVIATPALAHAQTPKQAREWTPVRVAKWALLGISAGFGTYALVHSVRAEDAYDDLHRLCELSPARCQLSDGFYDDPLAESLYRRTTREDRMAQVGIVGGQVTLLGSIGLFVYDLRNGRGPENIPYPSAQAARRIPRPTAAFGLRLAF